MLYRYIIRLSAFLVVYAVVLIFLSQLEVNIWTECLFESSQYYVYLMILTQCLASSILAVVICRISHWSLKYYYINTVIVIAIIIIVIVIITIIIIILNNTDIFFTVCNLFNVSLGMLSNCNIDCCEGSYCNINTAVSISTSAVTSFVAVLMAMFQNLFPTA